MLYYRGLALSPSPLKVPFLLCQTVLSRKNIQIPTLCCCSCRKLVQLRQRTSRTRSSEWRCSCSCWMRQIYFLGDGYVCKHQLSPTLQFSFESPPGRGQQQIGLAWLFHLLLLPVSRLSRYAIKMGKPEDRRQPTGFRSTRPFSSSIFSVIVALIKNDWNTLGRYPPLKIWRTSSSCP